MGLFKKKCTYCGIRILRGKEIFRYVKVPELTGTKRKPFISEEHANKYKREVEEKKKCDHGGSCCG